MPHPRAFFEQLDKPNRMSLHEKNQAGAAVRIQRLFRTRSKEKEDQREWVLLPILIIPGFASSGLYIQESGLAKPERYVGRRTWMDIAFLASERMTTKTINEDEIREASSLRSKAADLRTSMTASGGGEEDFSTSGGEEDFFQSEVALQVRSAWLHHMSLSPNMVDERPGNKVRVYNGLEGIEYLSDDAMTQVGSWVHAPVTKYLCENLGYTKGKNLDGAPYDWRLPPKQTEIRDGYLSKTISRIEELYHVNGGLPVVLVCHSMGCKMGHYFLSFCREHKGQAWIDKFIHTYMPVGAPHGGVSLAVRSGVTGKGLNDQVDMLLEGDDEGLVLYRSWGSGAWLMPRYLPMRVIPSCIVRKEGELALKITSSIQVGPLFANREKPPKHLRLTMIFRGNIRAHTQFVSLDIHSQQSTETGQTLDATVTFNETFYLAVPYLGGHDQLGDLYFYLEEPAGRMDQNPGKVRQKFRSLTSWTPVKAAKKQIAKTVRDFCKKFGTVLRVAVCANPWRLHASQFIMANGSVDPTSRAFLEREVPMCGCVGNDDFNPLVMAKRTVAYNDNPSNDGELSTAFAIDELRAGVMKATDTEVAPRLDQPLGSLRVKVCYTPPPKPNEQRAKETPVAAMTPGRTPYVPIVDPRSAKRGGEPQAVFEMWNGHDLLEHDGFCGPIWDLLKDYYEGDPLGPTAKSALDAPPVKRVRAIYGINLDTEVSAVYRHRPVVVVGDDMADSRYVVDTSAAFPDEDDQRVESNAWAKHNLHDYKMVRGRILETPQTLQSIPGQQRQRRCCGDGTVPYWNLIQCLSWKDQVPDLVIDELKGAEHRGILSDCRFHALLKRYCRVRDPRASAMLHLRQQNRQGRLSMAKGAGGIGTLKSALNEEG